MIIPILNGLLKFSQAPVTWILFLLNMGVFMAGVVPTQGVQSELEKYLDDETFLITQGRLYVQYVEENPQSQSDLILSLAKKAQQELSDDKLKILGSLAIRNSEFLEQAPQARFRGDQIEIEKWRSQVGVVRDLQDRHPSYVWGLTSEEMGLERWVSYIFVHSGPVHLVSNMYFLLIFGCMLEPLMGGLALLIVFLSTGILAAGVFLLLNGATAAPLIGASGAVSGLMVLFCLYYWRVPVRYMYMLLPSTKYVGYVFLPSWCVGVMFLISDLAGYLGGLNDFGGVAYSAHLGGEATALVIGSAIYLLRYRKPNRFVANVPPIEIGQPISVHETIEQLKKSG